VEEGVLVVGVMDHTPAADAGLQGGDVIVSVGERPVTSLGDFRTGVSVVSRGLLRIRVVRKGEPVEITIRK
jgi:S1-C subfamily serine protease